MANTPRLAIPEIAVAQASKEVTANEAFRMLEVATFASIEDRDLTAPPTIVNGNAWIPKATATGDWTGMEDDIAFGLGGAWSFFTPIEGMLAWVKDENKFIMYDGSTWTDVMAFGVVKIGATPAATGAVRLTNNEEIKARNNAGTADISMMRVDAGDLVEIDPGNNGVKFGTHTVIGAETLSGFITITDNGGTSRKVAVVS